MGRTWVKLGLLILATLFFQVSTQILSAAKGKRLARDVTNVTDLTKTATDAVPKNGTNLKDGPGGTVTGKLPKNATDLKNGPGKGVTGKLPANTTGTVTNKLPPNATDTSGVTNGTVGQKSAPEAQEAAKKGTKKLKRKGKGHKHTTTTTARPSEEEDEDGTTTKPPENPDGERRKREAPSTTTETPSGGGGFVPPGVVGTLPPRNRSPGKAPKSTNPQNKWYSTDDSPK